ncbi:MAG: hypothetical protein SF052_15265 [Bacteroidia bacterium]|nr:hypothetical protein [Bacteroidia bacterium]
MKANKNLLIIGGMVLLTIIAFLLISYFSGPSGGKTDAEVVQELTREIEDLESSLLEVEVVLTEVDRDLGQKKELLDQKYDEINFLTQKLEELEKAGNVDKATIRDLKQKLAEAKNKLYDASQIEVYKKEIDLLVIDNSVSTRRVDSMKLLMERYDSVFIVLNQETQAVQQQLADCGGRTNTNQTNTDPVPTTNPADDWKGFRADNFRFYRNNDNTPAGTSIKGEELEKLKIQFDVEGKEIPNGEKDVYIVFENFLKNETFFSKNTKGGNFTYNGMPKVASAKAILKYNGNKVTMSIQLLQDEEGQFKSGAYNVLVYCEGEMIGQKKNISIY